MPSEYIPIFVFALIVAAVPALGFALARRAHRAGAAPADRASASHPLAFEETERRSNNSQIFLVGVLVVTCDAAIVFLIPWAVRAGELGLFGLIASVGFSVALACGYLWLYRNRVLERL